MIYCYRMKDGTVKDLEFPMGEAPPVLFDDNEQQVGVRDHKAEQCPQDADKGQHNPQWPMNSQGMGINPDQIDEAMKHPKAKENRHQYDRRTGAMVFDSQGHRKLCMDDLGHVDLDGGYGDACGR